MRRISEKWCRAFAWSLVALHFILLIAAGGCAEGNRLLTVSNSSKHRLQYVVSMEEPNIVDGYRLGKLLPNESKLYFLPVGKYHFLYSLTDTVFTEKRARLRKGEFWFSVGPGRMTNKTIEIR